MAEKQSPTKVDLWEGYTIELAKLNLLKDVDFLNDFQDAIKTENLRFLTSATLALCTHDGKDDPQAIYDDIREHITKEKGFFDIESLVVILGKIHNALPKAGTRAQSPSLKIVK